MSGHIPPCPDAGSSPAHGALLYARTDERGVLLAANAAFRRVTGCDGPESDRAPDGAPAAPARRPEMPRALCHLLGPALAQGRTVGAYLAQPGGDGQAGWVYAVMSPEPDGVVTVGLSPCIPDEVKPVLAELLAADAAGTPPAESAQRFEAALAGLGWGTYPGFAADALLRELTARDAALGRAPDAHLAALLAMQGEVARARTFTAEVTQALDATRTIPANLRIQAFRLGDLAGPIGVIAINHADLSRDIDRRLAAMLAALEEVSRTLSEALFVAGTARLRADLAADLRAGPEPAMAEEMRRLGARCGPGTGAAGELRALLAAVTAYAATCAEMGRIVTGLNVTRIMCRVESARLLRAESGFDQIIGRLDTLQSALVTYLEAAGEMVAGLRAGIDREIARPRGLEAA